MTPIVCSNVPITLLGGGSLNSNDLPESLSHAPRLVAVDGGGDAALARGHVPEAVIGDMDSLSAAGRAALAGRLHRLEEQDTTDFDKALRSVEAPLVLAVGMTGGRFDHDLAALNVLVRHPDRRCVLIGADSLVLLAPPRLSLDLEPGTGVSLFPLGPVRATGTGLRWPVEGIEFSPAGRIGTSNAATGPVSVAPVAPLLLLILPRATLPTLVPALLDPDLPAWPS